MPVAGGAKLRFSGTIGGSRVKFRIGGRRRTDVSLGARDLNLGAATAGLFTATIDIGSLELQANGTLRAVGSKLRYP